jgi:hypothetical protein
VGKKKKIDTFILQAVRSEKNRGSNNRKKRGKTARQKNTKSDRFFTKKRKSVNRREALILKGAGSAAPSTGKPQADML